MEGDDVSDATTMTTTTTNGRAALAPTADAIEKALGKGDLSALTAEQRMEYLRAVCESTGLNPLTRPFEFLTDKKGKVVLYARADAARQLAKLHGITLELVSQLESNDLYVVHARATAPAGAKGSHKRTDEDVGVVSLAGLRGEDRANAIMKCVTKAKRRATLSVCGLGLLDETETEGMAAAPRQVEARTVEAPAPQVPALPAPHAGVAAEADRRAAEKATPQQIELITSWKNHLGLTGQAWKDKLAPYGVSSARDLAPAEADRFALELSQVAEFAEMVGADGLAVNPAPATGGAHGGQTFRRAAAASA